MSRSLIYYQFFGKAKSRAFPWVWKKITFTLSEEAREGVKVKMNLTHECTVPTGVWLYIHYTRSGSHFHSS